MKRRTFLATMSGLAALDVAPVLAAGGKARIRTTSNSPSRKVIVGTAMQAFWGPYPLIAEPWRAVPPPATRCRSSVGFRYYEDEDRGIFWSNDPGITVGEMVRSIGVLEIEEEMARVRQFYRKAGVRI